MRGPALRLSAIGMVAAALVAVSPVSSRAATTPVVVIVMENQKYQNIVGSSKAPFINNTMIAGGVLETDYTAIQSGSLANYLAMTSGVTSSPSSVENIFGDMSTATPWKEFEESMPSPCYTSMYGKVPGSSDALYTPSHNPAIHYANVSKTPLCQNVVPLDRSFDPTNLPAFSYVVPNQCNDMHTYPTAPCPMWNGGTNPNAGQNAISMGDYWLSQFVPLVASEATVVLTWDEGSTGTTPPEHIVTVEYGVGMSPGSDGTAYSHYGLEAGLYSYFGLGQAPGGGATATPLPIGSPPPPPGPHVTSFSPSSGNAGTQVAITGSGFTGATVVTLAGLAATFTPNPDTSITASVPGGDATGPVCVTAGGQQGCSTSTFSVDNTAPSVPSGLTPDTPSSSTIPLSWDPSTDGGSGVAGYNIYRCQGSSCSPTIKVNGSLVTGTSYTDTGLSSGTAYTYAVTAVDHAGNESAFSSTVTATTANGPSVVQVSGPVHGSGAGGSTCAPGYVSCATVTWTSPTQPGNTLIAAFSSSGSPAVVAPTGWGNGGVSESTNTFIYYYPNNPGFGAGTQVQFELSASSTLRWTAVLQEVSGIAGTVDQSQKYTSGASTFNTMCSYGSGGSTNNCTPSAFTPAAGGEYVAGVLFNGGSLGGDGSTLTAGWTSDGTSSDGSTNWTQYADLITTSTNSLTAVSENILNGGVAKDRGNFVAFK